MPRLDVHHAVPAPGTPAAADRTIDDAARMPTLIEHVEALWSLSRLALRTGPAHAAEWARRPALAATAPSPAGPWTAALQESPAWIDWMLQVQAWQDPAQALPLGLRPRLSQEPDSVLLRSHRLERDVALSGRLQPQIKLGLSVRF